MPAESLSLISPDPEVAPSARSRAQRVAQDRIKHAFTVAAATGGDVLLRAPAVCALIGVSVATLYRMMSSGEFPRPISITRGTRQWSMSAVQEWITARLGHHGSRARGPS